MKHFDPLADKTEYMIYGMEYAGNYMPIIEFTKGVGKMRFTEEEATAFFRQLKVDLELESDGWQEIYLVKVEETRTEISRHRPTPPVQGELFK